MKIHGVIHGPTDGLGSIAAWGQARGYELTETHLYRGETLPPLEGLDLIVVMGGAMNIYQHRDFPWLVAEKEWLAAAVAQRKRLLGVCLGGQLLADVLGGKVVQNPVREIGWWPIRLIGESALFAGFPREASVFHWHGDTFLLPAEAQRIAESDACANQAFVFRDRIVGLQFHLEVTPESVAEFIAGGEHELQADRFVQTPDQVLRGPQTFAPAAVAALLDRLAAVPD